MKFIMFEQFMIDMIHGEHSFENDQFSILLTNERPDIHFHTQSWHIVDISSNLNYISGEGFDLTTKCVRKSGEILLVGKNYIIYAEDEFDPFMYQVLYNKRNRKLLGYWQVGYHPVKIVRGDVLTIDFLHDQEIIKILSSGP